jgi:hypothetical protein
MTAVQLDIPLAALAGPITEIMATLTPEQKVSVAVSVINSVLNNPKADAEFVDLDKRAIAHVRSENRYNSRELTDEQCREYNDYTNYITRQTVGPRAQILSQMMQVAKDTMEESIKKAVLESPVTKATIKVVSEHIVATMPTIIARALTLHVAGSLDRVVSTSIVEQIAPDLFKDQGGNAIKLLSGLSFHQRISEAVQKAEDVKIPAP